MSKNKSKLTKQGVRDLNNIKSKSINKKYVEPPANAFSCKHNFVNVFDGFGCWVYCNKCKEVVR